MTAMRHPANWCRLLCILLSVLIVAVVTLIVLAVLPWWLVRNPSFGAPVTDQAILVIRGHRGWVNRVAFSPDGTRLASAGGDSDATVKLWDSKTGKLLLTLKGHAHGVYSVAFSRDGRYVIYGGHDNTLKTWNTDSGQLTGTIEGLEHHVRDAEFSPDGQRIATADGTGVR